MGIAIVSKLTQTMNGKLTNLQRSVQKRKNKNRNQEINYSIFKTFFVISESFIMHILYRNNVVTEFVPANVQGGVAFIQQ